MKRSLSARLALSVVVLGLFTSAMVAPAHAAAMNVAMPVPKASTTLAQLQAKHHDYPAADIPVPVGTSVYAVIGGTVTRFYEAGGCGYGINITRGNMLWTYCHGNGRYFVNSGVTINTGVRIMQSGNTGSSTGPHLHIQVKINGVKRCPQPLLVAAWRGQTYDPQNMPTSGCTY